MMQIQNPYKKESNKFESSYSSYKLVHNSNLLPDIVMFENKILNSVLLELVEGTYTHFSFPTELKNSFHQMILLIPKLDIKPFIEETKRMENLLCMDSKFTIKDFQDNDLVLTNKILNIPTHKEINEKYLTVKDYTK